MHYLMFDTETMSTDEKLIFDLGYAVHDERGKILHKDHFLVSEVFDNSDIMDKAFYKCNIPIYLEMLKTGKITKEPFDEVLQTLQQVIRKYGVETLSAYNLLFDMGSLYDTANFVFRGIRKPRDENGIIIKPKKKSKSPPFFPFCKEFINKDILGTPVNYMCLYGMAVSKLLTQDEYIHCAMKNNWFTESGNIQTGAECAYRFIANDYDFKESHTALDDVLIEVALFKKCQETPGDYTEEIIYTPYRLVQKRYEEMYGESA